MQGWIFISRLGTEDVQTGLFFSDGTTVFPAAHVIRIGDGSESEVVRLRVNGATLTFQGRVGTIGSNGTYAYRVFVWAT